MNDSEKRDYAAWRQLLDQTEAAIKFVINLKEIDTMGKGYLNERMIIAAFNNTIKDMKQNTSRIPPPNE